MGNNKVKTEMGTHHQVSYSDRIIEYNLIRKQVKNINLRIKPDGKILVSANKRVSVSYIDEFIKSKGQFIINAYDYYKEQNDKIIKPKQYINGENIKILGKNLSLKVMQGIEERVTSNGQIIILKVKDYNDFKRKETLLNDWLKEQQIIVFDEICKNIYPIFKKYGVDYPVIKIRYMKSRWGSCHYQKGIITLNSKLIEMDRSCIEYVVLHEFAHFIHPNHSKKFYEIVEMYMPDWKERKKGLKA